jgi:hypothetical protein
MGTYQVTMGQQKNHPNGWLQRKNKSALRLQITHPDGQSLLQLPDGS